jgi:arylformamidase
MTDIDLEKEYVDPALIQELQGVIPVWERDAAAYREAARGRSELDVPYGDKARQRLDIFKPASGADGPVALFIHGGYWQMMDKSSFSHLARGPNERGITVAVAGYTLCPEATMAEIVDEMRRAVVFLAKQHKKPVTIYGHSAGGHLMACLLATDWASVDPSLTQDTVRAGLPISGIFDLEPVLSTSPSEKLRLDMAEARRLSPISWTVPAPEGARVIAYVGGRESSEFRRQTRDMVARLKASGVDARGVEVPDATHFTVIAPLADPASAITGDLISLTKPRA